MIYLIIINLLYLSINKVLEYKSFSQDPIISINKIKNLTDFMQNTLYVSYMIEDENNYLILDNIQDKVFNYNCETEQLTLIINKGNGPGEILNSYALKKTDSAFYVMSANGKIDKFSNSYTYLDSYYVMKSIFPLTSFDVSDSTLFFSGRTRDNQLFSSINMIEHEIDDLFSKSYLYKSKNLKFIQYSLVDYHNDLLFVAESINTGLYQFNPKNQTIQLIDDLEFINNSESFPSISAIQYKNIELREKLLNKNEIISNIKVFNNFLFLSTFKGLGSLKKKFKLYVYDLKNKSLIRNINIDGPVIGEHPHGVFYKLKKDNHDEFEIYKISIK